MRLFTVVRALTLNNTSERERERERKMFHIIINYTRTIIEQSHACFEYAFGVVFGTSLRKNRSVIRITQRYEKSPLYHKSDWIQKSPPKSAF